MQTYFGKVSLEDSQDVDGVFISASCDTHAFYYGVEFGSNPGGTDEVTIFDGCERSVPVDIDNVPKLIKALEAAYAMHRDLLKVAENIAAINSPDYETHID